MVVYSRNSNPTHLPKRPFLEYLHTNNSNPFNFNNSWIYLFHVKCLLLMSHIQSIELLRRKVEILKQLWINSQLPVTKTITFIWITKHWFSPDPSFWMKITNNNIEEALVESSHRQHAITIENVIMPIILITSYVNICKYKSLIEKML